jgi:hypothetical protein
MDPRWRSRLRALHRSERGMLLPVFAVTLVALVAGGFLLFEFGRATTSRASAQTAADAAALAAADNLRAQLRTLAATTGFNEPAQMGVNYQRSRDAAGDFARRNNAQLTGFRYSGLRVTAEVVSNERVGDVAGRATATAELKVEFVGGGPAGGPPGTGGSCPIPEAELAEIARDAGMDSVPSWSALRKHRGCGAGGVSVSGLTHAMKVSILKLEDELGGEVPLSSAYRSPAYQAQLCARLSQTAPGRPCAAPGASMHNRGLAIDVPDPHNRTVAAAVTRNSDIALCQPLPANDRFHFSHRSGPECGGSTGTLGPGGAFGGNVGSYVTFEIRLVD